MRLVALVLLLANLAVWFAPGLIPPVTYEASAGGILPRVASLKLSDSSEQAPLPPTECVRVGWFDSREDATAFAERVGEHFRIEERERELPPLNWVMIPPQPREVALSQFRDLFSRGVESYVVTEGEYRNAISLGLFESRAAAESVLEEKKQQNLNVVLVNFPRNRIGYALVFDVEPARETEVVQAVEAESHSNFDFVEIYACEGVASPEKNP